MSTLGDYQVESKFDIDSLHPTYPYAYVWLLMLGDSYLPGVFVSVYSAKRTNPAADLVVMVTSDVSTDARQTLSILAKVVEVPYIEHDVKPMKTERGRELYSKWMRFSFTKWNLLNLHRYKKVILMDADTIFIENIDNLFDLPTPAAPFNSPFIRPLGTIPDMIKNSLQSKTNALGPDKYIVHGYSVSTRVINDQLTKNGLTFTASTVLISPSKKLFNGFIEMLNGLKGPFGFSTCYSAMDEQALAYYMSKILKKKWTNIHQRYNLIGWKERFLSPRDYPRVIHYISEKPWNATYNKWEDMVCWWKMAAEGLEVLNISPETIKLDPSEIDSVKSIKDKYLLKFGKDLWSAANK